MFDQLLEYLLGINREVDEYEVGEALEIEYLVQSLQLPIEEVLACLVGLAAARERRVPRQLVQVEIQHEQAVAERDMNVMLGAEAAGDHEVDEVRRVVLCSGKIYYELLEARRTRKRRDVAILRLEQLYPFPQTELTSVRNIPR